MLVPHTWMFKGWICKQQSERTVQKVMLDIFKAGCTSGEQRGIMLDVGSNTGIFGLLGIHTGCETIFFDIQPECHALVNGALVVNGWQERGRVIAAGITDLEHATTVGVNKATMCDGKLSESAAGTASGGKVQIPLIPLSNVVPADTKILMLKIDTEGNEARVLRGALPFFEAHSIVNAIVEVSPGNRFWERAGITREEVASVLGQIAGFGYSVKPLDAMDGQTIGASCSSCNSVVGCSTRQCVR